MDILMLLPAATMLSGCASASKNTASIKTETFNIRTMTPRLSNPDFAPRQNPGTCYITSQPERK
jgi:hypothetical protein